MAALPGPAVPGVIVEQRLYSFRPGAVTEFLAHYDERIRAVQIGHLGCLLGYYTTETGLADQVMTLWGYRSMQDRMIRRRALFADSVWIAYLARVRPLMTAQECRFLVPAPFMESTLKPIIEGDTT